MNNLTEETYVYINRFRKVFSMKNKTYNKKKVLVVFLAAVLLILALIGRLVHLMIFDAEYYQQMAEALHEREREIKAARGEIVDRNGTVLATNKTVCTISVIHSQIEDAEKVIEVLSKELEMDAETVRKRVEKVSSMEKVKTNVEKEIGDRIRNQNLAGVKVDEDYKRYYPYDDLASKVLGFTGSDNQGILALESKYDENALREAGAHFGDDGCTRRPAGGGRREPGGTGGRRRPLHQSGHQYPAVCDPACGAGKKSEGGGERFHPRAPSR